MIPAYLGLDCVLLLSFTRLLWPEQIYVADVHATPFSVAELDIYTTWYMGYIECA
jgi:hypothetical protein